MLRRTCGTGPPPVPPLGPLLGDPTAVGDHSENVRGDEDADTPGKGDPDVGADRLLFGTGFPDAEGMMAITQLMYADLADEQKRLIGAGNLERLIGEVRS